MRPARAIIVGGGFLGAMWLLGCGEGKAPGTAAIDCIRNMSRYSREGNVTAYLDCFAPDLRRRLEQARDEMAGGFADYLRQRAEPVRGIAFSDETLLDESTVRVKVEWVFEDRNEVQFFQLKKIGGAWKIADMTEAEYKKPIIPYGTKVFE
ncbi:MAG: hypothetical protein AB1696_21430 [Planctomycetota bacterium]